MSQIFTRLYRVTFNESSLNSQGRSSSKGTGVVSPIQTKTTPWRSSVGYLRARIFEARGDSTLSMSPATHWPFSSKT